MQAQHVLDIIKQKYSTLNNKQIESIKTTENPLLIIAGPGTGKTFVLILRTLYILLSERALPKEIVLTTFTEKAAFEMRDRISQMANKLDYEGQISDIKINTIHGICNEFIDKSITETPLHKNYLILDELTQYLFFYEYFDEIVEEAENGKYLGRWQGKWRTINYLIRYINKITEELIDPDDIIENEVGFKKLIAEAYKNYEKILYENNRVDFPHLQKIFYQLLESTNLYDDLIGNIKYIMVDEYQDTNYIQEKIMLRLAKPQNNICVVGDEDQSLYRFRGATVRNILEFPKNFENCRKIKLTKNYRSHTKIIERYNQFMESIVWSDHERGHKFRFNKEIEPAPEGEFPDYPSVFNIWAENKKDEAERIVDLIKFLKKKQIIKDFSQVALLLKSVKLKYSQHYLEAFNKNGIEYYAPRARAYFENEEVKLIVGCYAVIFDFLNMDLRNFRHEEYFRECVSQLRKFINTPLTDYLKRKRNQLSVLKRNKSLDMNLGDYFYQLIAYPPFNKYLEDENKAHNLSMFSELISIFQSYYNISIITYENRNRIKYYLFGSFMNFLLNGGINEYEDPDRPKPKGCVQVMTIHQAKGLEFPVVIVDSIDKNFRVSKIVDKTLGKYYQRETFETDRQKTIFDRMRHFYVAFSRAEKMLILSTATNPKEWFNPIWEGLDQWPYVKKETLKSLEFELKDAFVPKKSYSISSVNMYEVCPLQYKYYEKFDFSPSRSGQKIFGILVHSTIEDLHNTILANGLEAVSTDKIERWFETNYRALLAVGLRALNQQSKETALKHVVNYFMENRDYLERIVEAETDVSYEKEEYIISGKVDLLLAEGDKFDILDFKTQTKPSYESELMVRYFKQLCLYAYILRKRYNKIADKLIIYWTAEEKRKDAITRFSYKEEDIINIENYFDEIIQRIEQENFQIREKPDEIKVCKECDFRSYCSLNGTIKLKPKGIYGGKNE